MSALDWAILTARLAVSAVFAASVLLAFRIVHRRCPRCALLLAAGVIARTAVGLSAFWISYDRLPVFAELQLSPGFWDLAPDAETYYESALSVLNQGLGVVNWERGSPVHIVTLAGWMTIVGVSPAAAFVFNLIAYAWTSVLLVIWFAPDRSGDSMPALVGLLGFSLSPALLLHGSQPLKDEFFLYMVVVSTIAAAIVLKALMSATARAPVRTRALLATAIICAAVYLMAGIRTYYPPLLVAGLAVAVMAGLRWVPRRLWSRYAASAVALLAVVSLSYLAGAGSLFQLFLEYGVDRARQGFIGSPAATSMITAKVPPPRMHVPATLDTATFVSPPEASAGPSQPPASVGPSQSPASVGPSQPPAASIEPPEPPVPSRPPTIWDTWIRLLDPSEAWFRVRATAKGLLAMFVPISLLRSVGAVDFTGGRGLLLVTDVDTMFMNLTLVLVAWVCWTRRKALQNNWPLALMLLIPTVGLALLEAYVVTNFGSMFRMRLTMVATAWLLPLALVSLPDRRLTE